MAAAAGGGLTTTRAVSTTFDETVENVKKALAAEGFGILTQIAFSDVVEKKLNKIIPRTIVLGACNPPLVHSIYDITQEVLQIVPCNVTVCETEGGPVEVRYANPTVLVGLLDTQDERVKKVGEDALARISRAIDSLE